MNASTMNSYLALALEDPDKKRFTDKLKMRALNTAQLIVPNLLNDAYIADLQVVSENESVSSGKVAYSDLPNKLLRGNDSIVNVKVNGTGGLYLNMLTLSDLKKTENSLFSPSETNLPMGWTFAQGIQALPTSISALDVFFMKQPSPLNYGFYIGTGSPATSKFIFYSDQDVSSDDDFYNGTVMYIKEQNVYVTVKDYTGATREVEVDQTITDVGALSHAYFVPTVDDFHLTHLSNVTCELEETLHDIVLKIAEAICWKIGARLDRANTALNSALTTIQSLNEKYETRENIGVAD